MGLVIILESHLREKDWLNICEEKVIEHVLKECRYNQSRTAKKLNLSRGCLRTKLKQYFGDKYFRNTYDQENRFI